MSDWKAIIERQLGGRSIPIVIIIVSGLLMFGVIGTIRTNVIEIIKLAGMPWLFGVIAVAATVMFIAFIGSMGFLLVMSLVKLARHNGAPKVDDEGSA